MQNSRILLTDEHQLHLGIAMPVFLAFTQFVSRERSTCREWIKGQDPLLLRKKMVLRAKNVCLPHLFSRKRKREPSFKLRLLKPELSLRWHNYFVKKKRKTYFQGILHLNFPLKHLAQRVAYLPVNTKIMITNYETLW